MVASAWMGSGPFDVRAAGFGHEEKRDPGSCRVLSNREGGRRGAARVERSGVPLWKARCGASSGGMTGDGIAPGALAEPSWRSKYRGLLYLSDAFIG